MENERKLRLTTSTITACHVKEQLQQKTNNQINKEMHKTSKEN